VNGSDQNTFNRPQRIVITYSYMLPYRSEGWKEKALGGWGISGVTTRCFVCWGFCGRVTKPLDLSSMSQVDLAWQRRLHAKMCAHANQHD
jgi:hypothetical protein